ncbi:MAG: pyrroloquinoline quinone biosynthesis protein PqqE [Methanosaeta sp. PtaB.Bin039]|nr:MAG: pyrroloquinoline quinone biosynthesis protein PqqE [Methanosaeta sp. PtaB.Bin039]
MNSRYNIYFKTDSDKYLVYNTLSDAIIRIDGCTKRILNHGEFNQLDNDTLEKLYQNGFLVDIDDRIIFRSLINKWKHQNNTYLFKIIFTHKCNMACKYCYQGSGEVLTDSMDQDTLECVIKFIKKKSAGCRILKIALYGGEPFLEKEKILYLLDDLNEYCCKENKYLEISGSTNGSILGEDLIIKLKKYPIDSLQITFAGNRVDHDTRRIFKDATGSYDKLIGVLNNLELYKIKYHVRVDVDKENFPGIGELLDDLKEKIGRPPQLSIQKIIYDPVFNKDLPSRILEMSDEHLHELYTLATLKGYDVKPKQLGNIKAGCGAIYENAFAIDPHGDVYKCAAVAGILDQRLGCIDCNGNLTKINQEIYYKWLLRNPLQFEECFDCEFAPICFAGCSFQAYAQFGDIDHPICHKDQYMSNIETNLRISYPAMWL